MVVVPIVVVPVSLPGSLVSVVGGGGGGSMVGVSDVVVVLDQVVVDEVVRWVVVVVVVVVVTAVVVPEGVVECRDVCTTATTINAITARPPTPAASTAPRRSYQRSPSATGTDGRASRSPRHS
ncbi:MAG: hypothetical protein JWR32_3561 [Mycobacterium sp.]|nr:hypothetical protein [Mycobacterium sp.]